MCPVNQVPLLKPQLLQTPLAGLGLCRPLDSKQTINFIVQLNRVNLWSIEVFPNLSFLITESHFFLPKLQKPV